MKNRLRKGRKSSEYKKPERNNKQQENKTIRGDVTVDFKGVNRTVTEISHRICYLQN